MFTVIETFRWVRTNDWEERTVHVRPSVSFFTSLEEAVAFAARNNAEGRPFGGRCRASFYEAGRDRQADVFEVNPDDSPVQGLSRKVWIG